MQKQILDLVKQANPKDPIDYTTKIVRKYSAEKVNKAIMYCNDCNTETKDKSFICGNLNANILIAGNDLEKYKESIFDKIFDYFNYDKNKIIYVPTICCNIKKQQNIHIKNCKVFFEYFIKIVQPKVIVLLGSDSISNYLKGSVFSHNGKWFKLNNIDTMPLIHPNYFNNINGIQLEEEKLKFTENIKKVLKKESELINGITK